MKNKHYFCNMTLETFSQRYHANTLPGDKALLWHIDAQRISAAQDLSATETSRIELRMIMLVKKGMLVVNMDHQNYEMTAGCFADIDGTNSVVRFVSATPGAEGYVLLFINDFIFTVFNNRPPFDVSYVDYIRKHPVAKLNERMIHTLCDAFRSLEYSFMDSDNLYRNQIINNKVLILYLEISNYHTIHQLLTPKQRSITDRRASLFNELVGLVRDHAQCEHGVEFYASALCITPQYLGKIVRETAHKSVSMMINDAVVFEIKRMLDNQSLSLQQIVSEMKFSDQAVFSKFFKRKTGMTPMQYRNSL